MSSKSLIIIISLLGICIFAGAYVFIQHFHGKDIWTSFLLGQPRASRSLAPWEERQENEWSSTQVFHNEKYGYSLVYPSTYLVPQSESPEQVFFMDSDIEGPGRLAIVIRPTGYKSADEFIKAGNEKAQKDAREKGMEGGGFVIEKRIKIAGYDALVTYYIEQIENSSSGEKISKSTFFVRDGFLFEIGTTAIKHELVWSNFKFDK